MLFIRDGQIVDQQVGALPLPMLRQLADKNVAAPKTVVQ
jgi:hypothetical protein